MIGTLAFHGGNEEIGDILFMLKMLGVFREIHWDGSRFYVVK